MHVAHTASTVPGHVALPLLPVVALARVPRVPVRVHPAYARDVLRAVHLGNNQHYTVKVKLRIPSLRVSLTLS